MNFPSELKYTKDHEWVKINDDGTALIGITDYAQKELGDIVYIDITTTGKAMNAEEVFGAVEAVKTVSDLFLPVAGTILEVNETLDKNPELVNSDPYDKGWMAKIKIENLPDTETLLSSDAYSTMVSAA